MTSLPPSMKFARDCPNTKFYKWVKDWFFGWLISSSSHQFTLTTHAQSCRFFLIVKYYCVFGCVPSLYLIITLISPLIITLTLTFLLIIDFTLTITLTLTSFLIIPFTLIYLLIITFTLTYLLNITLLGAGDKAWISSGDESPVEIDESLPHSTLQIKTYEGKRMLIKWVSQSQEDYIVRVRMRVRNQTILLNTTSCPL